MPFAPELRTHSQKVCTLYKVAMRNLEAYYAARNVVRYHQVMLRAEFDKNKCVTDPKEQRRLLWVGENDVFMQQYPLPPAKFARSIGVAGGVAYARVITPPDWVIDYWHPLEKAHFPEYFRRREARKCEYIQKWHQGQLY
ncbi:NADH dehydrogenase [ubiquinone] 1 beta subcomplex subunit 9-like [Spodoptera litura]|uniref:NADH dehydrogenase [ubiquinone] 1 beta subcomplex subunit 9 n=1 Tax=Spodoptera litura TaxID=69820 RepID=A0A9J7DWF8_SPOLT|nr:NADH dehydrogenase [ubiquinone] 1 beta subcomplex subunit 9-like [Spodoptera litura]